MTDLTCYRIKDGFDAAEEVVNVDKSAVRTIDPISLDRMQATLFLVDRFASKPRWSGYLEDGFGDAIGIPQVKGISAVLVVKVEGLDGLFAFAFGTAGRHQLLAGTYERNYGLRAALNLIYPDDPDTLESQLAAVRSMDRKRVSDNTTQTREQAARATTLEAFELDRLRDVLRSVTGTPRDQANWGRNVTGRDAIKFTTERSLRELETVCRDLEAIARRDDYKARYPWVDDLRAVLDQSEIDDVYASVVDELRSGDPHMLFELSPPEIIDWERVRRFGFHFDKKRGQQSNVLRPRFDMTDFLRGVDADDIEVPWLKRKTLDAFDGDGVKVHSWPILQCITGSIHVSGNTYVIDDGDIYEVSTDSLADLDREIAEIALLELPLPSWDTSWNEGAFNQAAADSIDGAVLLDAKTVTPEGERTPIEVCDILLDHHLVHTKRHFASKTLSHLFAQGYVSADALLSPGFRDKVRDEFGDLGVGPIDARIEEPYQPREWSVIYLIVGNWRSRTLAEALPFFSKMTLRHYARQLTRLGYKVRYAALQV